MRFELPRRATGCEIRDVLEKAKKGGILKGCYSNVIVLDLGRTPGGGVLSIQGQINQYLDSPFGEFRVIYNLRSLCNKSAWYQKQIMLDRDYSTLSLVASISNDSLMPGEPIRISTKNHRLYKYIAPYVINLEEFFAHNL
ncbi:MAG: hypothetical protein R3346_01155 [Candidatus Spechtbacterales bacterium]|nr:hypothetical protein [Candidatus Spechtbacterales bacterium]